MLSIVGYHVIEKLYESSRSLVCRGRREIDQLPVILKILRQEYPPPEAIARFKLEFELTQTLNSDHIVKAYALEKYQHSLVMVLEDFGGRSLNQLIKTRTFSLEEALKLGIQLAVTLDEIHRQQIIHKDINPSNIVLNPKTGHVKIIDFGISTLLLRETSTPKSPHILEGTLAYMSPEQTGRMNRSIDYRTDFYSLGVTLYELLARQRPFQANDVVELVHSHLAKCPTPAHELNPEIPLAISQLVMKLMEKMAEDRYQSASGIRADLEECLRQLRKTHTIQPFPLGHQDSSTKLHIPQKLYGRDAEIATLLAAFERVANNGVEEGVEEQEQQVEAIHSNSRTLRDVANAPTAPRTPPRENTLQSPHLQNAHSKNAHSENAHSELLLVSGYSGIGKSVLVQELYKPITQQRGYFITGKFDQYQQNSPYLAVIAAFSDLMRQLLTEPEQQLSRWRENLLSALGSNGQVISELIPELELIIGPQPAVPELSSIESQNRFNLVFQTFIGVFTQPEHPLVLFLDDLQWADAASLMLMQQLITDSNSHHLFLVGAYRENEVNTFHPLMSVLENLQESRAIVNHITLSPLTVDHVNQLLADTLNQDLNTTERLAHLVCEKTGGNPFFLNEFLYALETENLLRFDIEHRCWQWNLTEIQTKSITNNVVDLLIRKVQLLSPTTQHYLQLAACIGNRFDLNTLTIVCEASFSQVASALQDATIAGLVMPLHDAYLWINWFGGYVDNLLEGTAPEETEIEYQFVHDRIQQTVYSLIPDGDRKFVHYTIGSLLLEQSTSEQQDQQLFDITNHFLLGCDFVQSLHERRRIAELCLFAERKARSSIAYEASFRYIQSGLEIAAPLSWQHDYDLLLALYESGIETAYLSGRLEQMDEWVAVVMHYARTPLDLIKVYETKIQAYAAQTQFIEALHMALHALKQLGVELPEKPTQDDFQASLTETVSNFSTRQIGDLVNLPRMTDSRISAVMKLLSSAISPAYIAAPEFLALIVFKQVNLSVEYGSAPSSPFAFAMYGLILCGIVLDIESGYQFGQLALQLLAQPNIEPFQAKTLLVVYTNVHVWKATMKSCLNPLDEAHEAGLANGDLEFAGYGAVNRVYYSFYAGQQLAVIKHNLTHYIQVLTQLKQGRNLNALTMYLQVVYNLMEVPSYPSHLVGKFYDEFSQVASLQHANDRHALFHFHLHKLVLNYLFQDYEQAICHSALAENYLDGVVGLALIPVFYFYDSLTRIAIYDRQSVAEQSHSLQRIDANQEKLKFWANHAPANFLHKWQLVEAERHRILDQNTVAADIYDCAITEAETYEYIQEAALSCELAGNFYLTQGKKIVAKAYLQEARYYYLTWGAKTKVRQLEQRYPQWLRYPLERAVSVSDGTTSSSSSTSETLDLATVMKASQAVARELVLERLLSTLLRVAIENAGAQTGYLILEVEGTLRIEAVRPATGDAVAVLSSISLEKSDAVSVGIVNYVARTQESVVLSNASQANQFANDPYILRYHPKSILCTPLVNQGKLIGVLYLENDLVLDAFKPERVKLLKLLSTQMAIAIENARLLKHQEELNQSLQHEREQISQILERITDGFIAVDRHWQIIYVNQQAEHLLGTSSQALINHNLWDVYPNTVNSAFYQRYHEAIDTGKPVSFEELYAPIKRWFEVNAYPDQKGLSIFFRDVTERKQMEEKLIHDALHDALTGLPNRLLLTEKLEQAIRKVKRQPDYRFAVLFLDVDRFKVINDSLGHLVGDQLLMAIARRLEACLSNQDTIARLGGDEFIILLDNPADEARVAARIQLALNVPFDLNGYKVFNTVSIGIVSSITGYDRPDDLLRAADIAMYRAKAAGKARYVMFDAAMQDQATSLLKLETDLRWAIERRELRVHYQPILSLATNNLVGFEALVRWIHPEQGLVSPAKFIPLAEETGLIVPIGQWVLQEACRQLRIWQLQFPKKQHLTMSVNLSVKQFSQSDLIQQIDQILSNMDLMGEHLKLEITESALISNPEATRELFQALRSRNIQLCIDDFGTGYSSLSYLHQFPVDILKIDRSFIRYIGVKNQDSEIVRTILSLARNLNVEVIAEGIEIMEQLKELQKLGCQYGQGFLFAKPLDSEAATILVANQTACDLY